MKQILYEAVHFYIHQSVFPPLISNRQAGATWSQHTQFFFCSGLKYKGKTCFIITLKTNHRRDINSSLWWPYWRSLALSVAGNCTVCLNSKCKNAVLYSFPNSHKGTKNQTGFPCAFLVLCHWWRWTEYHSSATIHLLVLLQNDDDS